jgi:Tol biopolymer transport system component
MRPLSLLVIAVVVGTAIASGLAIADLGSASPVRDSAPPIAATADCRPHSDADPAWSPTGAVIAFARAGGDGRAALYSIRPDGTRLRRLWTPAAGVAHAPVWSPDGQLIAVLVQIEGRRQLWVVAADGGNPRLLLDDPYEPRVGFRDVSFSPDGRRLAFVGRSAGSSQLEIIGVDGSERTRLTSDVEVFNPRWSPEGRFIAYRNEGRISVIEPSGSAVRDLTPPFQFQYGEVQSWSPDGRWLAHEGGGEPSPRVAITSGDGGTRYSEQYGLDPIWAPRGQLIAYRQLVRLDEGRPQIFLLDAVTMSVRRLTSDLGGREGADNFQPAWSPTGTTLVFTSSPKRTSTPNAPIGLGPGEIRLVSVAGTRERRLTYQCILGTAHGDRLTGTRLNDVIVAGKGDDRVDGRDGPDLIVAGAGNDRVAARDGVRDRIICGPGRDVVVADRRDVAGRDCESLTRR